MAREETLDDDDWGSMMMKMGPLGASIVVVDVALHFNLVDNAVYLHCRISTAHAINNGHELWALKRCRLQIVVIVDAPAAFA